MILLEKQVCSLKLSKRLKELRVKQESALVWYEDQMLYTGRDACDHYTNMLVVNTHGISTFTVAELGVRLKKAYEQLQGKIIHSSSERILRAVHGGWRSRPGGQRSHRGREAPEASPRYVRLLRRDIDLHDGHAEFADLRQGLHGLEEPLLGRIDPLLHRLLIAPGGGLVEGDTDEPPPVQVQPTREDIAHQHRLEWGRGGTGKRLLLGHTPAGNGFLPREIADAELRNQEVADFPAQIPLLHPILRVGVHMRFQGREHAVVPRLGLTQEGGEFITGRRACA